MLHIRHILLCMLPFQPILPLSIPDRIPYLPIMRLPAPEMLQERVYTLCEQYLSRNTNARNSINRLAYTPSLYFVPAFHKNYILFLSLFCSVPYYRAKKSSVIFINRTVKNDSDSHFLYPIIITVMGVVLAKKTKLYFRLCLLMNGRQPEMENEMGQNIFVGILCVLALGACVWAWWISLGGLFRK